MADLIIRDEASRARIAERIACLPLDKPTAVTIGPLKDTRSLRQNRLYWKWIGIIARHEGSTPATVHEVLQKALSVPIVEQFRGQIVERWSTKEKTVAEMAEYMEAVDRWAASECGIVLPTTEYEDIAR